MHCLLSFLAYSGVPFASGIKSRATEPVIAKALKIFLKLDLLRNSGARITHRMLRLIVRLLCAGFVSGALVLAQDPEYTLKVDVPYVSVDVAVWDSAGRPINDLPADTFTVLENGIPQDIVHFAPVSTPYNVLLLFDRSGSTQDKWLLMQRAVAGFIASLR